MTIRLLTPENLIPLLTACHSARRASLPEVAESTVSKCEGKPSPWEKVPVKADEGWGENALPRTSPTVCHGPPYLEGIGLFFRWWILRLRPVAARRMTALPEVSKFHNGMKGILSPLLVEQVLLTWLNLLVSSTMKEVGCMLSHISRHHVCRVTELAQLRSIYSQNDHPFTDTWESDPIDFSMSFCTKGIHARSCRIHHWCEWIIQLHPSGHSI